MNEQIKGTQKSSKGCIMNEYFEKIAAEAFNDELFNKILKDHIDTSKNSSKLRNKGGLDMVEMVNKLEMEFGKDIVDKKLDKLNTVGQLRNFVRR